MIGPAPGPYQPDYTVPLPQPGPDPYAYRPDSPHPTMPLPPGELEPISSVLGETILAQIAEIQVTTTTVRTPGGVVPLRGSIWEVTEQWYPRQKMANWGLITGLSLTLALFVLGFVTCVTFCLAPFALLFLLAKETVYDGFALVSVRTVDFQYVARIPVHSQAQVIQVHNQVNYARALASV